MHPKTGLIYYWEHLGLLDKEPYLKDNANKYGIQLAYNSISSSIELRVLWYQQVSTFLSFPTRELAEEFLTNFRELIEQAGDLI